MSNNLQDLVVEAVDEFEQLARIYDLLKLCIEQLQDPTEKTQARVEFLLDLCLPYTDLHLGELRLALGRIQKVLGIEE